MAKPTGGLLAFSARGSIAKTIVFASWRGRAYVRQHVIPANPRSTAQMDTRHVFSWLSAVWKQLSGFSTQPWTAAARGLPVTDRNLFVKANLRPLLTDHDLSEFTFSNGAKGGVPLAAVIFTSPMAGQIQATVTTGPLPDGWSLNMTIVTAILDQNPLTDTDYSTFVAQSAGTDPTLTISGLAAGTYVVGVFSHFTKSDGSVAYSPAIMGSQVVA